MNIYYVYIEGKYCNPCYIKCAKNENKAKEYFENAGYNVTGIINSKTGNNTSYIVKGQI